MSTETDDNFNHPFWQTRGTSNEFNNRIMLTAVISLAFVVILVTALHIYARCVLRRQAQRRIRAAGQIGNFTLAQVNTPAPPKTGLDPAIIGSLPFFTVKDTDTVVECAVCLSMLEDEEMARLLPNCKHTFHVECIDKWLSSHSTCPICRAEAEPVAQPEANGAESIAAPLERGEASDGAEQPSNKVEASGSRLSSFRRMLSTERSSRRIQYDIERQ